jgi:PmbA protein
MNINEKYKIADLVINHAIKNGADQIVASIDDSSSRRIEIREQKIDRLQESIGNTLTIKLYVKKKYSAHTTNHLKEKELLKFVEEAITATKYLTEDEFRYLPEKELYYKGGSEDLKTLDPAINSIDSKTKIELARQVEGEVYGTDKRIVSVTSYYFDNVSNQVLVASNGFRGETGSSAAGLSADVSVKGETGRPSDYWSESNVFFDRFKKTGIGKTALERALNKLNPKKIASGKYPMIIENLVAGNLLGPFLSALYGASMYQKNSFLIGKVNSKVGSDKLSFEDNPLLTSGIGSRLFDFEGLATSRRPIIEEGILRNYFIGTYYGRKLKLQPTTANPSNLVFKTGGKDLNSLIKSVDKGVFITGFNGGNCNGSTGDFSYGIEGFLIEKGNIIHPVNEMNISGNMTQFWNTLTETGNDPNPYSQYMTPSMLFENTDFSGI